MVDRTRDARALCPGIATGGQLVQQALYLSHVGMLEAEVAQNLLAQWHNLVSKAYGEHKGGLSTRT
jgi:hypothetical protein